MKIFIAWALDFYQSQRKRVEMAKYQLTDRQRTLLRAASEGLKNGDVKDMWTYVCHGETLLYVHGFEEAKSLGISLPDLRNLERLGFLILESERPERCTYIFNVLEQVIHDAVDGDFEDPSSARTVASTPDIRIEQGEGSSLNVSVNSRDVSQTINASPSLPGHAKADLEREVESLYKQLEESQNTKPHETRSLEKHLKRFVEDAAESQPDRDDVINSLSRVERASQALASFASIVTSVSKIGDIVARLPFMQ